MEHIQVRVPSLGSSGPKHFTNVASLLLKCWEPLDQRGSTAASVQQPETLSRSSGFYTRTSSPRQEWRPDRSVRLPGRCYLSARVMTHPSCLHVRSGSTHLLHLLVHLFEPRLQVWTLRIIHTSSTLTQSSDEFPGNVKSVFQSFTSQNFRLRKT